MPPTKIIYQINELKDYINSLDKENKKKVLCQGHFNVIHPGHLRFLEFAKKHGDILIVVVQGENKLEESVRKKFYTVDERAYGVASLVFVDKVYIFTEDSFDKIINIVKPHYYILGEEFSKKTNLIQSDIQSVEQNNGKVIFGSGDMDYSISEYLDKDLIDIKEERLMLFRNAMQKQNITKKRIQSLLELFHKKHILVIGETIVDQYIACDPLGMSSEAPVLVIRELENKSYIGGAAIVARHIKHLGADCMFISLLGSDEPASLVKNEFNKENINSYFLVDEERPTTFKIRYMVEQQKILRVSRLIDQPLNTKLEEKVIQYIEEHNNEWDGIIVSDFGYGMITPNILDCIFKVSKKYNKKLFGDSQSSSQIGDISKFMNYDLIKPTEKEARFALDDKYDGLELIGTKLMKKTKAKNIVLTLGANGFIAFQSTDNDLFIKTQHFPAINPHPVDVVGAGDALLTGLAISICAGGNLMEASVIGTIIASISVGKMGNIPISHDEVIKYLENI